MTRPSPDSGECQGETTHVHTRLIRCGLEIDESSAFWAQYPPASAQGLAQLAFENYWFGAKSMARVKELITNMRARFSAFPQALAVLRKWPAMRPETRAVVCHWHLQLTDPLYRGFTGDYLHSRHAALRPEVSRALSTKWLTEQVASRWALSTRTQYASKLLTAALAAGLVSGRRDPRQVVFPRISDDALTYLLYLLRCVNFAGSLLDNPYVRSVGLEGSVLDDRLRGLSSLDFRRTGDLVEFGWVYPDLQRWAEAELIAEEVMT